MFHVIKRPGRLVSFVHFLLPRNQRLVNTIRPLGYFFNYSSLARLDSALQSKGFLANNGQSVLTLTRSKYNKAKKKRGKQQDEESSDEEDEEEEDDDEHDVFVEKGAEIKTYKVKSIRVDLVLKVALGISRNKIEEEFYANKIRVNGEIIRKKSQNAKPDDEIDLIKGQANDGTNFIIVGRVKILKVESDPDSENILLKVWKAKSLKIENYQSGNEWRDPVEV